MSRLETLRYKRHQGARRDITENDVTRITERLPLIGDVIKATRQNIHRQMRMSEDQDISY